jgi:hypothetical protein
MPEHSTAARIVCSKLKNDPVTLAYILGYSHSRNKVVGFLPQFVSSERQSLLPRVSGKSTSPGFSSLQISQNAGLAQLTLLREQESFSCVQPKRSFRLRGL